MFTWQSNTGKQKKEKRHSLVPDVRDIHSVHGRFVCLFVCLQGGGLMDGWLNYWQHSTETHDSSSASYCLSPRGGQSAPHVSAAVGMLGERAGAHA